MNVWLPWRYRAFCATIYAIGVSGFLLRAQYPKSIFVALFVMSLLTAGFACWSAFQSRLEKSAAFWIFTGVAGLMAYSMYLTIRSILI